VHENFIFSQPTGGHNLSYAPQIRSTVEAKHPPDGYIFQNQISHQRPVDESVQQFVRQMVIFHLSMKRQKVLVHYLFFSQK